MTMRYAHLSQEHKKMGLPANAYLDSLHAKPLSREEEYKRAANEEESDADGLFVVIPDEVYHYCRPKSYVETPLSITSS
jgi:hypothetical protein